MKRLSDQVMVLQSIKDVKAELAAANADDPREISEIMIRLGTLYACLDIERITRVLRDTDTRDQHRKKAT